MGIVMEVRGAASTSRFDIDSAEYLNQQELSLRVWMLTFTLAGKFIDGFGYLRECCPYELGRVLTNNDMEKGEAWHDSLRDWGSWNSCRLLRGDPWTNWNKRSDMNWTTVSETFREAEATCGELTPEIEQHIRRIFRFQGTEESTEVAFQTLENVSRDSHSRRISALTVWHAPSTWGMFEKRFNFKEVDPENVDAGLPAKTELPQGLYDLNRKEQTMNFKLSCRTSTPTSQRSTRRASRPSLTSDGSSGSAKTTGATTWLLIIGNVRWRCGERSW